MSKILVVDDEMKIARLVRDYLTEAGFDVVVASTGPAAVAAARGERPDLVVLDIGLPGIDGYDVTRSIRAHSSTPIIMLTARSEETDRIVGLELGADDYVVKPFSPRELVARVKAVLRRTGGEVASEVIRVEAVVIDIPHRRVEREGIRVELTTTEFELLRTLAASPGRVFTRGQLLDAIRGVSFEAYERAIDTHVKNLRKKLEPDPRHPVYVLTVYGVGYRFADA
jgi:DNA-binding response OmpR family regulator